MNVDLIFEPVDGATPVRTVAFLHGILGRGMNLRAIAKRLVEARPAWQALLVDLRGHGRSPKGTPSPSLEATARDVVALAGKADLPLAAIVGHSFGGKVALEAARVGLPSLEQVVVIDSAPGPRAALRGGDSALGVIETLESLPSVFMSKSDFTHALMAAGQSRTVAEWLATSLERHDGQFRFGLDLNEIRALILDYLERDLWPVVENPPGTANVHLIIAEQSDTYSPADRERAMRIAASANRVTVDVISGGHWLHVDNPGGLLDSLLFSL